LKVEVFLEALREDNQPHVVNCIITDGKMDAKFGHVRPLSEQQRRRLWSTQDIVAKLDLKEGSFLDLLQTRAVISALQRDDVLCQKSCNEKNLAFDGNFGTKKRR
jgi:hypothetical protein